jgi:signal transduction histidine kinase
MRIRRHFPSSPIVFVLLLTLALTGVITYEAQDAIQSHRRSARRVLADYADLASSEFARRTKIELEFEAFQPGLQAAQDNGKAPPGRVTAPPAPKPIVVWIDPDTRMSIDLVRYNFRLPFGNGGVATGDLATSGEEPPAAIKNWLRDTLAVHARAVYLRDWPWAAIVGPPEQRSEAIVYRAERDSVTGALVEAVGFVTKPNGLDEYFKYAMLVRPLLPPSLTSGIRGDSLVAINIRDPYGRAVYESEWRYDSPFWAEDSLGTQFGHLVSRATLHPSFPATVIEGPPRSQLPLLAALFLVTIGLIVAALFQLRREHELARLRSDFVAGVSHELRTPLAQIRLFAETLLLGRIRSPVEERRSLEIIDQEAKRLTHLVENVLHFSRAERRAIQLVPEPIDVAALAREVVESFAPLATARETRLRTAIEAGVVAALDPGAVRQILLNLIDNAVKYGPPGQTVAIEVQLVNAETEPAGEASGRGEAGVVQLRVEDQGPGIPWRDKERIWERFVRLDRESKSAVAGTGIGLAVVRELTRLHGGRAWVEVPPAGGARFVVELPGAWRGSPPETSDSPARARTAAPSPRTPQ